MVVLRARRVATLIEFLMNWMRPSPIRVLTPPGWKLRAVLNAAN
jgi:hypothetical protein